MIEKPHSRCRLVEPGSQEQRALCARPRGDAYLAVLADRAIRREAWAERRHLKMLKDLQREADEAERERKVRRRFFRVKRQKAWGEEEKAGLKHHPPRMLFPSRSPRGLMPRYTHPITDKQGRVFVFQRIRYYSAKTTKQGHAKERAEYGMDGAHVFDDGTLAAASNLGDTRGEILEAVDIVELTNRTAAANGKTWCHAIMQSCYLLSPEEQFEAAKNYAEDTFGKQGLPYLVVLHPPSADGDPRNWHVHLYFSFRPVTRVSEGEWEFGRHLRTDLDCPEQFRRLRYLWASELNAACEKAGLDKLYTHLSYAAAGLDFVPQRHLGEGLTAAVRRGEHVRINLENHRIAARNVFKRTVRSFRSELLVTATQTRRTVENALNAAIIAQALRAVQPEPQPTWGLSSASTEKPPARPSMVSARSSRLSWSLDVSPGRNLPSRPDVTPQPAETWASMLPPTATELPKGTIAKPQQRRWVLPKLSIPIALGAMSLTNGRASSARPSWTFPASRLPALPRLNQGSGGRHPWALPGGANRSLPSAPGYGASASPPRFGLNSAPRPDRLPKAIHWRSTPIPFSLGAQILPKSLPTTSALLVNLKVRFNLDRLPISPPATLISTKGCNLSALKPPIAPAPEPEPAVLKPERPWLREGAKADLLKNLREGAVYVERLESREVRPVLMERGLYRFTPEDIRDPQLQSQLRMMHKRQEDFLERFNPVARLRIGNAQVNNGTKSMIRALPPALQEEAKAWASTALWDKIMMDLREFGLRRSEELIRNWKKAHRDAADERFKFAADASDQNHRWPIAMFNEVSGLLEEDAKVHRSRIGIHQRADDSSAASSSMGSPDGQDVAAAETSRDAARSAPDLMGRRSSGVQNPAALPRDQHLREHEATAPTQMPPGTRESKHGVDQVGRSNSHVPKGPDGPNPTPQLGLDRS